MVSQCVRYLSVPCYRALAMITKDFFFSQMLNLFLGFWGGRFFFGCFCCCCCSPTCHLQHPLPLKHWTLATAQIKQITKSGVRNCFPGQTSKDWLGERGSAFLHSIPLLWGSSKYIWTNYFSPCHRSAPSAAVTASLAADRTPNRSSELCLRFMD